MTGCILITGGAGFIGTNLARRLAGAGRTVRILDALVRQGAQQNVIDACNSFPGCIQLIKGDVRDIALVRAAIDGVEHVYHLAAQVAVTKSLEDPGTDFEINVGGTMNVLEAIRSSSQRPSLLYSSTNKVYGALRDVDVEPVASRYVPRDARIRANGIAEQRVLDFHSPYGCSKGAADQYVLDYARSYGLTAAVMRMSCIYGPYQHGNEDQGWVAHFMRSAIADDPVTIYGDGRQVRDVLFVDDLVNAFELARTNIHALSGRAFNVGGGPANTLSVLELIDRIEAISGQSLDVAIEAWRVGDQRYYVSDTRRFETASGWRPQVDTTKGLDALWRWCAEAASRHDTTMCIEAAREQRESTGAAPP
ncbi:MAG: NAD-dependent epimerase/dehydratase family protein [Gammaproteobacteria bacterium]|nr:CDP-paratose 2-epimerase [Gammaproteobacteria bacterium]